MIYFLECAEVRRIKIGTAGNPEHRLEAIRLMCPVETDLLGVIPGGFAEERELHDRFSHLRRHGEWFEATPELQQELWQLLMTALWNRAPDDWRERFIDYVQAPVFDNTRAGAA